MAFTAGVPTAGKVALAAGVHLDADTYKCALYVKANAPAMDATATVYSATGEVSGTGYTAGGAVVVRNATAASGTAAVIDFADPTWAGATLTGVDGYVIYNTSKSNKILYIGSLATPLSPTAGTLTITIPVPDSTTGLIRIS